MKDISYFGLTASSPKDLREVVADYLYDQGKDLESEAMRSCVFEEDFSGHGASYAYFIFLGNGKGLNWGAGDDENGMGWGSGSGEAEGTGVGYGDGGSCGGCNCGSNSHRPFHWVYHFCECGICITRNTSDY